MPNYYETNEEDIIRAGMFEDEADKADAIENDEAQANAAAEKLHNDEQHYDEGYDPQWDMYHDRYDDDPNPYHGTYSEE